VGLAKDFATTRDRAVGQQSWSGREVGKDYATGMLADIAAIAGAVPFRFLT
jgi:hypothetical protein